ncbi:hypothetical protein, partial [Klebsiella pneumoniae]|uniref:hypothetical protein n=1 Tax=Klebsiella pneumoniae TaxID=573 RepID=UPI001C6EC0EF
MSLYSIGALNAFYAKYQQLSVKLQLFFCNGLLTITASTASVGIDGVFSGINAIKTNTFFFQANGYPSG